MLALDEVPVAAPARPGLHGVDQVVGELGTGERLLEALSADRVAAHHVEGPAEAGRLCELGGEARGVPAHGPHAMAVP